MNSKEPYSKEWTLLGQNQPDNILARRELLKTAFESVRSKGADIDRLRQTSLNFAILIFAGLSTFIFQFSKGWYSVAVSAGLLFIMCVFSLLDGRFHRFAHGFRATQKHIIDKMAELVNEPASNIDFRWYITEAEDTAEWWHLQPIITYFLAAMSALHLLYSIGVAFTT